MNARDLALVDAPAIEFVLNGQAVVGAAGETILQTAAPDEMRGRPHEGRPHTKLD